MKSSNTFTEIAKKVVDDFFPARKDNVIHSVVENI